MDPLSRAHLHMSILVLVEDIIHASRLFREHQFLSKFDFAGNSFDAINLSSVPSPVKKGI